MQGEPRELLYLLHRCRPPPGLGISSGAQLIPFLSGPWVSSRDLGTLSLPSGCAVLPREVHNCCTPPIGAPGRDP